MIKEIDYKAADSPGGRDDSKKARYDLIPPEATRALANVLTMGAKKYADRNWEKGMDWGRVLASLMRHLEAWRDPTQSDIDEESGYSHMDHVLTNAAFLIAYEQRKVGNDNRS